MDNENRMGELQVKIQSGFGLFPIKNVFVTVLTEEKENSFTIAEDYTDEAGLTKIFILQGEKRGETEETLNFRAYTVEAYIEGYQKAVIHSVPVYPGVRTVQTISLVPLKNQKGNLYPYDEEMIVGDEFDFTEVPNNE